MEISFTSTVYCYVDTATQNTVGGLLILYTYAYYYLTDDCRHNVK